MMIKKLIAIIALAMLLGSPNSYATLVKGNDLLKMCDPDPTEAFCVGYISGAFDRNYWVDQEDSKHICLPAGSSVGQVARVVLKGLKENPEMLHVNASVIVVGLLRKAFPCRD